MPKKSTRGKGAAHPDAPYTIPTREGMERLFKKEEKPMIENCEDCLAQGTACMIHKMLPKEAFHKSPAYRINGAGPSGLRASKYAPAEILSTRKKIEKLVEENRRYNLRGKNFEDAIKGIKSEDGKAQLFRKNDGTMVTIRRPLGVTACGCPRFDPESGNLTRCCACYQMGDLDDEDNDWEEVEKGKCPGRPECTMCKEEDEIQPSDSSSNAGSRHSSMILGEAQKEECPSKKEKIDDKKTIRWVEEQARNLEPAVTKWKTARELIIVTERGSYSIVNISDLSLDKEEILAACKRGEQKLKEGGTITKSIPAPKEGEEIRMDLRNEANGIVARKTTGRERKKEENTITVRKVFSKHMEIVDEDTSKVPKTPQRKRGTITFDDLDNALTPITQRLGMIWEILEKEERTKRVPASGTEETIADLEQRIEEMQKLLTEEKARAEREKDEIRRIKEDAIQAWKVELQEGRKSIEKINRLEREMTLVQEEREKEKDSRQKLFLELETAKRKLIDLDAAAIERWEERMREGSPSEEERRRQLEEQEEAFARKIKDFYESPEKRKERALEEKLITCETIIQEQKAMLAESHELSDRLMRETEEQAEKVRRISTQKEMMRQELEKKADRKTVGVQIDIPFIDLTTLQEEKEEEENPPIAQEEGEQQIEEENRKESQGITEPAEKEQVKEGSGEDKEKTSGRLGNEGNRKAQIQELEERIEEAKRHLEERQDKELGTSAAIPVASKSPTGSILDDIPKDLLKKARTAGTISMKEWNSLPEHVRQFIKLRLGLKTCGRCQGPHEMRSCQVVEEERQEREEKTRKSLRELKDVVQEKEEFLKKLKEPQQAREEELILCERCDNPGHRTGECMNKLASEQKESTPCPTSGTEEDSHDWQEESELQKAVNELIRETREAMEKELGRKLRKEEVEKDLPERIKADKIQRRTAQREREETERREQEEEAQERERQRKAWEEEEERKQKEEEERVDSEYQALSREQKRMEERMVELRKRRDREEEKGKKRARPETPPQESVAAPYERKYKRSPTRPEHPHCPDCGDPNSAKGHAGCFGFHAGPFCNFCGSPHWTYECLHRLRSPSRAPTPPSSYRVPFGYCYNCKQPGHMAQECKSPKVQQTFPARYPCRVCGMTGHTAWWNERKRVTEYDCPLAPRTTPWKRRKGNDGETIQEEDAPKCFHCGKSGHWRKDCTERYGKWRPGTYACDRCNGEIHRYRWDSKLNRNVNECQTRGSAARINNRSADPPTKKQGENEEE